MEWASRAVSGAMRATNNNTVINLFLFGSFVALGIRSVNQQKDIEGLEAEKDSLVKSNKTLKKTMWDWKQQLYAEASDDSFPVPLFKLKAIYGEAPVRAQQNGVAGETVKEESKSSVPKFVI
ncbi:uncharacterized protein LOC122667964 [Telopea speciosissima]|uniref:uncharacterized protein LOC122667964 n=1 Tax=Telopea speciosissima TaxID=54955 RepID=UPI001CC585BE|nr:uncharacterized protein LOC122667964 [Telopea speciosissima]